MKNEKIKFLSCPVCKNGLFLDKSEKSLICENNHNFDIAKQGYINLLLSYQKGSKNSGDSKEMLSARREILNKDYFKKVFETLLKNISMYTQDNNKNQINILDLGCGEGYYLDGLRSELVENNEISYFGMDISKEAIKLACKRSKTPKWIVANNYYIPFLDDSLDIIYSIFSPFDVEECIRTLKNEGFLVRVVPNYNHLLEIKEIIYTRIDSKDNSKYYLEENSIQLINEENVKYQICLNKADINELLRMTPHFWKSPKQNIDKLNSYDQMDVTIDVKILVYKKV